MTLEFGQLNHSPDCKQKPQLVPISTLNPGDTFAFPNAPETEYVYRGISAKTNQLAMNIINLVGSLSETEIRVAEKPVIKLAT